MAGRQQAPGRFANQNGGRALFWRNVDIQQTGKYPLHVGVHDDDILVEGYAAYGGHSIGPQPRQSR